MLYFRYQVASMQQHWSLYRGGMRQPTIPALKRQPELQQYVLRRLTQLPNPICVKRFQRHCRAVAGSRRHSGGTMRAPPQRSTGTIDGPLLPYLVCVFCFSYGTAVRDTASVTQTRGSKRREGEKKKKRKHAPCFAHSGR